MAVIWNELGPYVTCVMDCGDTSICIGNYDFYILADPASDPFHLIINGQDYGIVGPSSISQHTASNLGCVDAPITINIDGVDVAFFTAFMTHCCGDPVGVFRECPQACVN